MRKAAGLKRGSRKKQQQQQQQQQEIEEPAKRSPVNADGESSRRKPTSEEAALTAKNYRLAKELSDLRVRHRDETKNVTRLTMENMNLASRCREAISHVAMLKKELAMHQRRAAEAMAMQRQQSQRTASSVSDSAMSELSNLATSTSGKTAPSSTDVAVEMDRMDRILAAHAPPPPPPRKDQVVDVSEKESSPPRSPQGNDDSGEASPANSDSSPRSKATSPPTDKTSTVLAKVSAITGGTWRSTGTSNGDSDKVKVESRGSNTLKSPTLFPHTASPKPKHKENYNDDYPGDVSPHKASHESSLPPVLDEEQESESQVVEVSHAREEANKKLSSIDAFEASFDTAFPANFASPKEAGPAEAVTSEIYNPFFPSPAKKKSPDAAAAGSVVDRSRKWGASLRDRSPMTRKSPTSSSKGGGSSSTPEDNDTMPKIMSSGRQPTIDDVEDEDHSAPVSPVHASNSADSGDGPDPTISPKIVSRASPSSGGSSEYRTPPQFPKTSPEHANSAAGQPRRPEKSASASARARYEKALQPRVFTGHHSNSSMSVDTTMESTKDARNSPSTVLRRLQQRREKSNRFQSSSSSSSTDSSSQQSGLESRRPSGRSLRHSVPQDESPFDEGGGRGRTTSQNGTSSSPSYRASQNDAENTYQRTRTSLVSAGKKLSPDSMNAEIRALDAMASSSSYSSTTAAAKRSDQSPVSEKESPTASSASSRLAALKQRRGIKQPVSYAEPPLNTKMRRGDVYFPKQSDDNNTADGNSPVVSPSNSGTSPEDMNGSRRRSRAGASPDEVLKDLAGPATVRS